MSSSSLSRKQTDPNFKEKVCEQLEKTYRLPFEFLSSDALTNTYYNYEKIEWIANWLLAKTDIRPKCAVICGSGLGGIANIIENGLTIPYESIPEFPESTVEGHHGNLIFGRISGCPVVCMQGRFHPFEGYSLAVCCMPIKLFKLLGCHLVFVTNAAGALNRTYQVGDLMVLKDHLSVPLLSLQHPLIGPNDTRFGPRFPPVDR
jgi:purine-nucleoside phosphorylase